MSTAAFEHTKAGCLTANAADKRGLAGPPLKGLTSVRR